MKSFNQLKKNLKLDFSGKKVVKIAILGDSATQFYSQCLRATGFDSGFDLQIFEADFNQIEYQVLTPDSELYKFQPEIVVIYQSSHKLLLKYNKIGEKERLSLSDDRISLLDRLVDSIESRLNSKIIYFNYTEIDDAVFGSFANKVESSFVFQLRKLNYQLNEFALQHPNFFVCDISSIQNQIRKDVFYQASIYVNTEMLISIDALPFVAKETMDIIEAFFGKIKKCLILDLDNTLWGGVIGDDGIESIQIGSLGIGKAFTEFQYWIKKLKERGIILAVCSKNTESVAKEPFEKHPDMVLKLDDIAVFVANWENKADNIRRIQSILNIGFDSMVFLDDNPAERCIVRENIPEITVPELPEDPADYLEYLYSLNLFETVSYSAQDGERTKQYQTEAKRIIEQDRFTNEDDFLKSLDMVSLVEPFNKFNEPRVAQLTQRSNQFNLRTVRYTDSDILRIANDNTFFSQTFTLEDKFGDNGLICIVLLKAEDQDTLFIDTWLMSCRVLKRGMENFTLNTIVKLAKEKGFRWLKGEYIPTPKNQMVRDHYLNLGFEAKYGFWFLDVDSYIEKECFISKK
ncbi:HAD family hydrolase [Dysgonomonas sp. 520]|uniref:HAD-IIIC family phosphatase n=1 Tax=Dysgonomonas sp. 520 TaxID=2302931 RepID=UPI0013D6EDDC|nr:HAD-IIIC family phosphatase [Dysgonomonas sp. 520]NDW09142.1 HAD-IIIC family phosphatase [Dysgonomonas sp. 520]